MYIRIILSKKDLLRGNFNFNEEFGCEEDIRFVVYDNTKKEFAIIREIEVGDDFEISVDELPAELDCKFKLQQIRDGKWYDASKYIQISADK